MASTVRWVVVDAEAMTHVDYSAARVVIALKNNLTEAGVELAFARLPWDLRAEFDRHHLTEAIGTSRMFNRLHDAIAAFQASEKSPAANTGAATASGQARNVDGPLSQE